MTICNFFGKCFFSNQLKTWNQIALVAWSLVNLSLLLFLQSGVGKSNWLSGLRAALPKHCMQQAQYMKWLRSCLIAALLHLVTWHKYHFPTAWIKHFGKAVLGDCSKMQKVILTWQYQNMFIAQYRHICLPAASLEAGQCMQIGMPEFLYHQPSSSSETTANANSVDHNYFLSLVVCLNPSFPLETYHESPIQKLLAFLCSSDSDTQHEKHWPTYNTSTFLWKSLLVWRHEGLEEQA